MGVLAILPSSFADVVVLHLVLDSVIGIGAGVTFVAAYLAVLRWLDRQRSEGSRDGVTRSADHQGQDPE